MKAPVLVVLLGTVLTMFVGCATPQGDAAYGREQELWRQLAETAPVKDYGYTIKELRLTPDSKKALVVFTHFDTKTRPDWEFVLTADEFGRYRGMSMQPFYTPGTANTPPIHLTTTLPPK